MSTNPYETEQRANPSLRAGLPSADSAFLDVQLTGTLQQMMQQGELLAAVLSTPDGLSLASIETALSSDILAGLSSLFADVARRSEALMDWSVEEVSLVNQQGIRLVTRQFMVDHQHYILVVVVPANKTYRRVTNVAVKKLKELLKRSEAQQA